MYRPRTPRTWPAPWITQTPARPAVRSKSYLIITYDWRIASLILETQCANYLFNEQSMSTQNINNQLIKLLKRAETNESDTIIETFVDIGPISAILSNKNNQIIYGRRGTGKTHALIYLSSIYKSTK